MRTALAPRAGALTGLLLLAAVRSSDALVSNFKLTTSTPTSKTLIETMGLTRGALVHVEYDFRAILSDEASGSVIDDERTPPSRAYILLLSRRQRDTWCVALAIASRKNGARPQMGPGARSLPPPFRLHLNGRQQGTRERGGEKRPRFRARSAPTWTRSTKKKVLSHRNSF